MTCEIHINSKEEFSQAGSAQEGVGEVVAGLKSELRLESNSSYTGRMERGEGEFRGHLGSVKERTTSSCRKPQGGGQKEAILTDSKHAIIVTQINKYLSYKAGPH